MARPRSISSAIRALPAGSVSTPGKTAYTPPPETPREKGERLKDLAKRYPKPKPRAKPQKGTLPLLPPKNRAERRRRAREGGGAAS